MKMKLNIRAMVILGATVGMVLGFQNCSQFQAVQSADSSSSGQPVNTAAAGSGMLYDGVGSSSVPTGDGVVARVTNALQGNVSPTAGNFAKSLASLRTNLPRTSDPSKATGFDQVQLLVYAACSDLTTGGANSKMVKSYLVPNTGTVANNRNALVAAGMKMFDQYTAGLASQGPTSSQVTAAFTGLLDEISKTSSNTTTIAFMSVCVAANTAGSTLLGF